MQMFLVSKWVGRVGETAGVHVGDGGGGGSPNFLVDKM